MRYSFLIILLMCFYILQAQDYNNIFYEKKDFDSSGNKKLFLKIENTNLFKNNEYFNLIEEGFTLIGYYIKPQIIYYTSEGTRILGGLNFLKYSGRDTFACIEPVFTFHYQINQNLIFLFGTIHGTLSHKLIEPIYQFDRYFIHNVENGLQLLYEGQYLDIDLWLNWERFILPGNPFQEEFCFGSSNKIYLFNRENRFNIAFPAQGLIKHYGGQIDVTDKEVQTLLNTASGCQLSYNFNTRVLKSISMNNYLVTYSDLSQKKQLRYIHGYGIYENIMLRTKIIDFFAGYWRGEYFIAPLGEPLYQSISYMYKVYHEAVRELLLAKLFFVRQIFKDIDLGIRFEAYYDMLNKKFEYSYGIHILFNRTFFLKDLQKLKQNDTT